MEIGTIAVGNTIGYKGYHKYIWHACRTCGKERWVSCVGGKPTSERCNPCGNTSQRGENHPNWKGVRKRDSRGYLPVRLSPHDFFYPMTNCRECVFEHRLVVAKSLGRCLHRWEIVHHKNGVKDDNRLENLQLVTDDRHRQITILENRIKYLEGRVKEQDQQICDYLNGGR